ncbi:hypothetical protein B0I35DRAFT_514640 [Stachybotrys elegans]|uniref:Uncharacterized protein n=1 Tax=Stachybotrys elegans TaxID=80388 RepID=A0A8K0SNE4_9HYPO|nr:hypothetical protein B0I35DRAFT_514640 [Stachybotrys elegans]
MRIMEIAATFLGPHDARGFAAQIEPNSALAEGDWTWIVYANFPMPSRAYFSIASPADPSWLKHFNDDRLPKKNNGTISESPT